MDLNCFVNDSLVLKPTGNGTLSGKTFVVKDLISIANHTSSFGHPKWRAAHEASKVTAPVVTRLLGAGAEMVGITKMDQLAFSVMGNAGEGEPPLNSLYPERLTCGSSSGSASAVAGGVTDIGIGTDTGGSIRVPAAACGLFSIRPTMGRIDASGTIMMARSFDVIGILTRDPALLLMAFTVLRQQPSTKTPIKKILVPDDCMELVESKAREALTSSASKIAMQIGAKIEKIEFGSFVDQSAVEIFSRIQGREIWKEHSEWISKNWDYFELGVRKRLERAKSLAESTKEEKNEDIAALNDYRRRYNQLVASGSVIAIPIMPNLPPKRTSSADESADFRRMALSFNSPGSLTGCPEVVVPVKHPATGLTYGLGLLGARNQDEAILNAVSSA